MTQKNFKVKNGLDIGDSISITEAGAITGLDTDDLGEGSTNQYFTNARARSALSGSTGVTYNSTTGAIAIGQAVGTTDDVSFDDITSTGTIKNAGKGIYAGSNRTFTGGDTTDVTRFKGTVGTDTYNAFTGLLASNADKTTTLGARPAVVIRGYGQNVTGGTTSTAANPTLSFETSRGTPGSPVAIGANEAISVISGQVNAGATVGTAYWTSDNYTVAPAQIVMATAQAQSATASASATFTANFTTGTTMTVTAVSSGTISALHELRYSSGGSGAFTVNNTFGIHTQLTSDQAAAATTTATGTRLHNTITVASATGIVVGQLVAGTGIPSGTFVGTIAGTTITLVNAVAAPTQLTASISASTVNFYTAGGTGTYQLSLSPYTATTTGVVCTTTATTLGNAYITRNQPSNHALTTLSRAQTQLVSANQHLYVAQSPYATSHFLWQTWPTTMPGGTQKTLMYIGPAASGWASDRVILGGYMNPNSQISFVSSTASSDANTYFSISHNYSDGSKQPMINFLNRRTTDNTNYTPTLNNDKIGSFKYNGNAYTTTSPGVPAGPAAQINCVAIEDWDATKNGARFDFTVIKKGTITDLTVIEGSSEAVKFSSDSIQLRDSSYNIIQQIDTNKILNNRPHRSAVTTASMARGNTYTPAAGVNNFIELELTSGTDPTYIDVDNLTVSGEGGHMAILVYNNSGSSIGNNDLVIRNNGTQINSTQSTIGNGSRVIFTVYCVGNYAACEYMTAA